MYKADGLSYLCSGTYNKIVSETHTFEVGYKKIIKIWYLDPNICNDTYHFVSFAFLVLALQLSPYPRHLFLHNSCYTHKSLLKESWHILLIVGMGTKTAFL